MCLNRNHFGMKSVLVALSVSDLAHQSLKTAKVKQRVMKVLNLPSTSLRPFPQITLPLLNLNWLTQEYSSGIELALCFFSGMPCFILFARQ